MAAAKSVPAAPQPAAPPTWSPEEYERRKDERNLVVVGVFRPVEMAGRTVAVPREVYLQATDTKADRVRDLLGKTLEVRRLVPVPAAVPAGGTSMAAEVQPAEAATPAPSPPPVEPSAGGAAAPAPASTARDAMARLRAMRKQAQQSVAAPSSPPSSAPAEASAPPSAPASAAAAPTSAPAPTDEAARIVRPRPRPLSAATMEVVVGRLTVVDVRGLVVVARVAEDGVGQPADADPSGVPADVPAVMAGDRARFVIPPEPPPVVPPPPPPPPLTADERARLEAERRKATAESWRRKNPRGKYEREVMKWKL